MMNKFKLQDLGEVAVGVVFGVAGAVGYSKWSKTIKENQQRCKDELRDRSYEEAEKVCLKDLDKPLNFPKQK